MNTTSEESDLKQNIRLLRSCTNPWRIEFARQSPTEGSPPAALAWLYKRSSAYAAIRKIKGLKPAKAGFVCVAANSIRQVQNIRLETLIDALVSQMLEESNRGKTGYSKYLCIHQELRGILKVGGTYV